MRKKKEKERRELAKQYAVAKQTAFHEAGHTAFATLKGPGIEIVTIDAQRVKELTGRECPGYTRYNVSAPADADTLLCLTAVGLTSEAMFVNDGVVSAEEEDIRLIQDILQTQLGLRGGEKDREFDRIRLLTQKWVLENKAAIAAIASALMERKTLSGEDVQRILTGL